MNDNILYSEITESSKLLPPNSNSQEDTVPQPISREPRFPDVIDSTILAAYSDCPLKCYREFFIRLASPRPSIHLHAGGSFAKAIETVRRCRWEEELSYDECLERGFQAFTDHWGEFEAPDFGSGKNKTFARMWQAVEFYFEEYPLDRDNIRPYVFDNGKTGVEFTFGIPLPIKHPDTGDPIIYGGRFDLLGYYNDMPAVVDEKTASALGASWPDQWTMRGQLFGYVWAARQSGIPVRHAIIRGVAILKTKFTTLEVIKSHYSDVLLDRWYSQMLHKVQSLLNLYEVTQKFSDDHPPEVVWPMNYSSACTSYGGCGFTDLCTSPDPTVWYDEYAERNWNPLAIDV